MRKNYLRILLFTLNQSQEMLLKHIPQAYNKFLKGHFGPRQVRTKLMESFPDDRRLSLIYEFRLVCEDQGQCLRNNVFETIWILKCLLMPGTKNKWIQVRIHGQFGIKLMESSVISTLEDVEDLHDELLAIYSKRVTDLNNRNYKPFGKFRFLFVDIHQ